ncbi:hypothetical protein QFC22_003811 [Naganishia vaughanmartiniae]|uniref:Uncharacterized protein n=1 Tax=Naganishia vaughanmartiniae TaxID=1424756 RepID=A0ACC2X596_9TREE|nr:hypothetical protein QFC22_003811 [Naganishia vaughanmartiniae]
MGSKSYPYKGALDLLASRAGADGLSAWTAIDHTAYTISSAGPEGFLNMLPVYLEHILYPTLTKEGFLSEIYHVDGKGEEGGVVFSEMQGIEQSAERILMRYANRETNSLGSGYGSVTGGLLKDIRQLTIEQIRGFHEQYYKPWNLCLHVDGSVPLAQLLQVLNKIVDPMILRNACGIRDASPPADWQRPWMEPIRSAGPVIEKDFKHTIKFMSDDETLGAAMMVWKGPVIQDHMMKTALGIVTTYLNDSEIAPLSQKLIDTTTPACTSIEFSISDGATDCGIDCVIEGIPHAVAQGVGSRLYQIDSEVKAVFDDVRRTGIDMRRMRTVILKQSRILLHRAENDVTDLLVPLTFDDFLYSSSHDELASRMDIHARYKTLLFWTNEQYFIANPCAVIIGEPSASLAKQVDEEGKAWLETLKARLGNEGLQKKADELAAAEKANHREIPAEILTDFPISDASKIDWVPVETGANSAFVKHRPAAGRVQTYLDADVTDLPYLIHFSHIESNFITIRAMLDTSLLPEECRPYLALYIESFFALPVCREDGTVLQHKEVVEELADLAVSNDIDLSLDSSFGELLHISLVVEKHQYTRAIGWLRDLLTRSVFEDERLGVITGKLVQKLPECYRDPQDLVESTLNSLVKDKSKSSAAAVELWSRAAFLPRLRKEMHADPSSVTDKLSQIRDLLIDPSGLRLSVAGDILSLPEPRTAWTKNFLRLPAVIVPMGSIEGSHAVVYSRGPQGWTHPELPACIVTSAILQTTESYFWKGVRGAGLAYHTDMTIDVEYGSIVFKVLRSPNCVKAVMAAGRIVRGLVDGTVGLNVNILDAARSSLAYTYAKKESNVTTAAMTVMMNELLKGVCAKHNANFLASLSHVTIDHVKAAVIKYFLPVFDPASSIMAVTCATGFVPRILKDMEDNGYHVQVKEVPNTVKEE